MAIDIAIVDYVIAQVMLSLKLLRTVFQQFDAEPATWLAGIQLALIRYITLQAYIRCIRIK